MWNQQSPNETALSTCETRVLKKNILKCQKNQAILGEHREESEERLYNEGYMNKTQIIFC